jgi:signal transduction histidine kinase/TPR repeat protein
MFSVRTNGATSEISQAIFWNRLILLEQLLKNGTAGKLQRCEHEKNHEGLPRKEVSTRDLELHEFVERQFPKDPETGKVVAACTLEEFKAEARVFVGWDGPPSQGMDQLNRSVPEREFDRLRDDFIGKWVDLPARIRRSANAAHAQRQLDRLADMPLEAALDWLGSSIALAKLKLLQREATGDSKLLDEARTLLERCAKEGDVAAKYLLAVAVYEEVVPWSKEFHKHRDENGEVELELPLLDSSELSSDYLLDVAEKGYWPAIWKLRNEQYAKEMALEARDLTKGDWSDFEREETNRITWELQKELQNVPVLQERANSGDLNAAVRLAVWHLENVDLILGLHGRFEHNKGLVGNSIPELEESQREKLFIHIDNARMLFEAASSVSPTANYYLALRFANDSSERFSRLKMAVAGTDQYSPCVAALTPLAAEYLQRGDIGAAIKHLRLSFDQHFTYREGMQLAGLLLAYPSLSEAAESEALAIYERLARINSTAALRAGLMHLRGDGTPPDRDKAKRCFETGSAQYELGYGKWDDRTYCRLALVLGWGCGSGIWSIVAELFRMADTAEYEARPSQFLQLLDAIDLIKGNVPLMIFCGRQLFEQIEDGDLILKDSGQDFVALTSYAVADHEIDFLKNASSNQESRRCRKFNDALALIDTMIHTMSKTTLAICAAQNHILQQPARTPPEFEGTVSYLQLIMAIVANLLEAALQDQWTSQVEYPQKVRLGKVVDIRPRSIVWDYLLLKMHLCGRLRESNYFEPVKACEALLLRIDNITKLGLDYYTEDMPDNLSNRTFCRWLHDHTQRALDDAHIMERAKRDAETLIEKARHEEKQKAEMERAKREAIEDLMSMFAHKFRGPVSSILFHAEHLNIRPKVYEDAARTMNGLLDIFGIVSTMPERLIRDLQADHIGSSSPMDVLEHSLNLALMQLLSSKNRRRMSPHYLAYAKKYRLAPEDVNLAAWTADWEKLEADLQARWESEVGERVSDRGWENVQHWMATHILPFETSGLEASEIRFTEYGPKASLLTVVFTEVIVNAIKHAKPSAVEPIRVVWTESDDMIILECTNPSTRHSREREASQGSGRGHRFLGIIANHLNGEFTPNIRRDPSVATFRVPRDVLRGISE